MMNDDKNRNNFADVMALYKYRNKIDAEAFLLGMLVTDQKVKSVIFMVVSIEDLLNNSRIQCEYTSDACNKRMGYEDGKKHYRIYVSSVGFKNLCNEMVNGFDKKIPRCSWEKWQEYLERAKKERGQANAGFALEYFVEDYTGLKVENSGIDLPDLGGKRVEIKWGKGGQFVL